ncbi:MAG: division/cell wall cluster transcriptional repressor MraZ [Burkholderiaceae bacterium]|jgi:MraZ protein|nr:division/cell wall cluster transcriptional repressor MraZ [Burkholderiaceae bacterium]
MSSVSLDAKGRMSIPTRYRETLSHQCEGRVTLARHLVADCLLLFPRPVWESYRDKLVALPLGMQSQIRRVLGSAIDVEIDSAGRILISPELRQTVALTRDVMLVGMGSRFEIWDPAKLNEDGEKAAAEVAAGNMAEALQGLVGF